MNNLNPFYKKILLVDDDHDDCFIFEDALSLAAPGAQFFCLNNSEKLAAHLQQNQYDLIFLDINMPRKNGFDCLQEIRRMATIKSLPVVMYSNSTRPQEVELAYSYGANLFIKKPVAFDDLVFALKKVLHHDWTLAVDVAGKYLFNGRLHAVSS